MTETLKEIVVVKRMRAIPVLTTNLRLDDPYSREMFSIAPHTSFN